MDIKQRLRQARWAWWLPAAFFVGICLLPSGHIEASPGEFLRPPVWMAPMGWPLLAMAVLFAGAAFSERLRNRAWRIVFLGAGASLLLGLALVATSGAAALYSWELGTDLRNRIFVDFELDVLAFGILPMDLLLAAISFLVLWVRRGRPARPEPAPPAPSPLPGAAPPAHPQAPAEPAPVPEAAPPGPLAAEPATPDSPRDTIAPGAPALAPTTEPPAVVPAVMEPPQATEGRLGKEDRKSSGPPEAPAPQPGSAPEASPQQPRPAREPAGVPPESQAASQIPKQ